MVATAGRKPLGLLAKLRPPRLDIGWQPPHWWAQPSIAEEDGAAWAGGRRPGGTSSSG